MRMPARVSAAPQLATADSGEMRNGRPENVMDCASETKDAARVETKRPFRHEMKALCVCVCVPDARKVSARGN